MQLKTIGAKWAEWKQGKDESWIYDEGYNFLEDMSRGDICSMLDQIEALTADTLLPGEDNKSTDEASFVPY